MNFRLFDVLLKDLLGFVFSQLEDSIIISVVKIVRKIVDQIERNLDSLIMDVVEDLYVKALKLVLKFLEFCLRDCIFSDETE